MNDEIKGLFRNKKRIKLIVIILIIIIAFVVIFPAKKVINLNEGTKQEGNSSNVPNVKDEEVKKSIEQAKDDSIETGTGTAEIKTADSTSGGYKIDIDLDQITDNIIENLEKNDGRLDVYLSKGKQKEYLKKMIKAELATQYPDLRSVSQIGTAVDDTEFQGVIRFIRHKQDGSQTLLEYIPIGEKNSINGNCLYGLINQANGVSGVTETQTNTARNKILNYFSIDAEGNLFVVKYTQTIKKSVEGSYSTDYVADTEQGNYAEKDKGLLNNVTDKEVTYLYSIYEIKNYQSQISAYTMPFEYLWAFLISGEDEKFVSDLADLALNSKIEISIYDNVQMYEEICINAYNKNKSTKQRQETRTIKEDGTIGDIMMGAWGEESISAEHYYEGTYTKTYTNTISNMAVTYVDIWYMTQSSSYTYETAAETNPGLTQVQIIKGEDIDGTSGDTNNITIEYSPWIGQYSMEGYIVISEMRTGTQIQYNNNQYETYIANNSIQYKYTANGNPTVTEKTNKNLEEGQEGYPNFCTLFLKSEAKGQIIGAEEWLFDILENNESTINMVDLTKYLLYCATEVSYGTKTFDFAIYNDTNFTTVGLSSEELLIEYIHNWEHADGPPTNADNTKYIVEEDGAGHACIGYGIDIYSCGYIDFFIDAGYDLSIGAEIDIDFVDSIEKMIFKDSTAIIEEKVEGLGLTAYQLNALKSRAYNCGIAGAVSKIRNGKNFIQAYQAYWSEEDDLFEEKNPNADFSHNLYTQYMSAPTTSNGNVLAGLVRRRKSEWTLFQTGYYDILNKWQTSGNTIVEAAYAVADHFMNSGVTIHYAGNSVSRTENNGRNCVIGDIEKAYSLPIEQPQKYGVVCATFVSLSLWKANACTAEELNNCGYNGVSALAARLQELGWKKITNFADVNPGDVIVMPGHIAIYVGDEKYIDQAYCVVRSNGKDDRGKLGKASSSAKKFTYALRYSD